MAGFKVGSMVNTCRVERVPRPPEVERLYCRMDKLGNVMRQYATLEQAVDAAAGNPVGDTIIYKLSCVARVTTVTNVEKF